MLNWWKKTKGNKPKDSVDGKKPPKLSPEETEEQALKDAFSAFDSNGDGKIEKGELAKMLERYHGRKPTERQLGKIMSKVDLDQNGVIDFPEFKTMMLERSTVKNDFISRFENMDDNKDGFISKEELSKFLNSVEDTSDEEIDEILALADIDNDGRIDFKEFMEFFM